jgi:(E)-4-hydroxy-3-methylbut-2-enyl-diphosphate synthase
VSTNAPAPSLFPKLLPDVLERFRAKRRRTRVVSIGSVKVGGDEPIRVQSMCTTHTWDVEATLGQIARLQAAGCEIVRLTVPSQKDADALPRIREGMKARGLVVPIVADIHFSPKMAMLAAEHCDKVRINPGNFHDGQKFFKVREYTDAEYQDELAQIEESFAPLVQRCKARGISMRIGTNHGSLSDRIMNRYGDSPAGMVESALEFARIARRLDYHDVIFSMKASNTRVMIEAYRLLVARCAEEGLDLPLHLGVTEAGDGDDARIKSAIGMGTLLEDGIGDTIRVSLTEDPVHEVPVGFGLARVAGPKLRRVALAGPVPAERDLSPFEFRRRPARRVEQGGANAAMGGDQPPRVEVGLGRPSLAGPDKLLATARSLCAPSMGERKPELLSLDVGDQADVAALEALRERLEADESLPLALEARVRPPVWRDLPALARVASVVDRLSPIGAAPADVPALQQALSAVEDVTLLFEDELGSSAPDAQAARLADLVAAARAAKVEHVAVALRTPAPAAGADPLSLVAPMRVLTAVLDARGLDAPVVLCAQARGDHGILDAATSAGGLLVDGIGDAVRVDGPTDPRRAVDLAFGILQGARRRTTRTEYISCPGCGRTLFELEPVTAKIKVRTSHLKGVKIAVMGCVVNGPGEMADADFGYVGWKPGKVNLYVGKTCVVRDVPEDDAPDKLVDLIKDHGRWVDPLPVEAPVQVGS